MASAPDIGEARAMVRVVRNVAIDCADVDDPRNPDGSGWAVLADPSTSNYQFQR
ncbi:hypothetical protein [[Kitasatospora] papulosa]|uniref:hypothetical protein n=1 Tax=[Kitasatospora] papulosa TaxID=1464011 RepID=UPI003809C593